MKTKNLQPSPEIKPGLSMTLVEGVYHYNNTRHVEPGFDYKWWDDYY